MFSFFLFTFSNTGSILTCSFSFNVTYVCHCSGAIALAEILAENRHIKYLDIRDNDIRIYSWSDGSQFCTQDQSQVTAAGCSKERLVRSGQW